MKKRLTFIFLFMFSLIVFGTSVFASEKSFVKVGDKAKNFRLNDQHLEVLELKELTGTPVIIIYTGRKGFDDSAEIIKKLDELYNPNEEEEGNDALYIVGISNLKGLPFFLKKRVKKHMQKPQYPSFLMDWKGEITTAYGYYEKGISAFIIDEGGVIQFSSVIENKKEDIKKLKDILNTLTK